MELGSEPRYPFAVPSPPMKVLRRSVIQGSVIGTCMFLGLWSAGLIPLITFVVFEIFFVGGSVVSFRFSSLYVTRAAAVLTPTDLVIERWKAKRRIPWQDVTSVAMSRYEPNNRISRLYVRLLYGQDGAIPFVKIALRRSQLGFGLPWMKALALYLQEPEAFVQETQRFLAPEWTHSAHA